MPGPESGTGRTAPARGLHTPLTQADRPTPRRSRPGPPGGSTVADTIKGKIEDAGQAAKDAATTAGRKVQDGADKLADKAAEAAKDAGQKLKDKSGA